jgi:hypothetical protein
MRPISKALFFSLVVLIFAFSPVIGEQPKPDSNLKVTNARERDLLRKKGIEPIPGLRDRYPSMFNGIEPFPYTESFQHPPRRDFPYNNSTGGSLTSAEQGAMKVIIDDFLVNDDTTGGCAQSYPAIARDLSGKFVITWEDDRNGNWDIYAQRYNSTGNPLGSNFKVNDDPDTASQGDLAISMDSSGNFVITWVDDRNTNLDIYAQRYNSSGTHLGSNFKVNEDVGSADQWSPAVAMDNSGNFVITWEDDRTGNKDIYAQRYNSSGAPLGSNFKVNDDLGTAGQGYPAISMDGSGNFVITWSDDRNYYDIYAQRYNFSGVPLGSNFKVNSDIGTALQWPSAIAMDGLGKFVVTWRDSRNGDWDIYAQRYNSSGGPLGSNFKVNDYAGTVWNMPWLSLAIAMDGSGNFVITWEDLRNDYFGDIYAQRYNFSGVPLGSNFKVNDTLYASQVYPAIAMDGSGNFIITWEDYRNSNPYIYAQRYNFSGAPSGSNFKVIDDAGTADQWVPSIAMDGSGKFVITWRDDRNGISDIYAQRYDSYGTPLSSNFKVNDDVGYAWQYDPVIAVDGSGNFVIAWEDSRTGNKDIYAQRYNSSGAPLDSNFKVDDDTGTAWQGSPAIVMDGFDNFIITWKDYRNYNWDIYAQRYSSSGNPLGSNFKVTDDAGTTWQDDPSIAIDGFGDFVITWVDGRNGPYDIYAQRYDSSGAPLDTNFKVNDDVGTAWQYYPAIAMDGSGNFVITWYDWRNGSNRDMYTQRYNSSGNPLGSNFKVNDDTGTSGYPAIAMDGSGNFVITWEDYRYGGISDIYAQRYNSSGSPLGNNYLVPNSQYASFAQGAPAVAANSSNIYFTWQDNRRAKGWDIYANIYYFLRGNVNGDEKLSLSDIVYLINYLFKFGPEPIPELGIGDANCDGKVSLSDIVYLINYLFKFGPAPCP